MKRKKETSQPVGLARQSITVRSGKGRTIDPGKGAPKVAAAPATEANESDPE